MCTPAAVCLRRRWRAQTWLSCCVSLCSVRSPWSFCCPYWDTEHRERLISRITYLTNRHINLLPNIDAQSWAIQRGGSVVVVLKTTRCSVPHHIKTCLVSHTFFIYIYIYRSCSPKWQWVLRAVTITSNQVTVKVTLRVAVGPSVSLSAYRVPLGAYDQITVYVLSTTLCRFRGALSRECRSVCLSVCLQYKSSLCPIRTDAHASCSTALELLTIYKTRRSPAVQPVQQILPYLTRLRTWTVACSTAVKSGPPVLSLLGFGLVQRSERSHSDDFAWLLPAYFVAKS